VVLVLLMMLLLMLLLMLFVPTGVLQSCLDLAEGRAGCQPRIG
jgi:hypothetical protein